MNVNIESSGSNKLAVQKSTDIKALISFYGYSNKQLIPILKEINSNTEVIFINYKNSILGTGGVGTVTRDMNTFLENIKMVCYDHENSNNNYKYLEKIFNVELSQKEKEVFHSNYSKLYIWPLLHGINTRLTPKDIISLRPIVHTASFKFAKVSLKAGRLCSKTPTYWVNDYVLINTVGYLRDMSPKSRIIFSLRTSFGVDSPPKLFFQDSLMIVQNLAKADLVTFHTLKDLNNFIELALKYKEKLGIYLDRRRIALINDSGNICLLRVVPLGSNPKLRKNLSQTATSKRVRADILNSKNNENMKIITSVSRFEESKGLKYELEIIDNLLSRNPELKEKLVFNRYSYITESKKNSPEYIDLYDYLIKKSKEINIKYSTSNWKPININLNKKLSDEEISGVYRATDILLVASLSDGFNHISIEGPLAKILKEDEPIALVLGNVGSKDYIDGFFQLNMNNPTEDSNTLYNAMCESPILTLRNYNKLTNSINKLSTMIWFTTILYSSIFPNKAPNYERYKRKNK